VKNAIYWSLSQDKDYATPEMSTNPVNFIREVLNNIRDDHNLGLKQQKDSAIQCIKTIIEKINTPTQLMDLTKLIEGKEFNFIRQLTSQFWLIRQIRGSHGVTSTYKTIIQTLQERATQLLGTPQDTILQPLLDKSFGIAGLFTKPRNLEKQIERLTSQHVKR
jgi:hypothetical protein